MARQKFDRSSKWLLENQGRALMRLAGAQKITRSVALQPEAVQPGTLPDGLLDVRFADRSRSLVLVEMATYPEKRIVEQVTRDMRLVRQARGVLPDTLVFVLCQKGTWAVPDHLTTRSKLEWSEETLRWKVVELWKIQAKQLLESNEVGLMPLVPLTLFEGPPEPILRQSKDLIDQHGGEDRDSLLAVSQVMTQLRFNTPECLAIFGGNKIMRESPLIQRFLDESTQQARHASILEFLLARFKEPPPGEVDVAVRQLRKEKQYQVGTAIAATCTDYADFLQRLREEAALPAQNEKSSRSRKKP